MALDSNTQSHGDTDWLQDWDGLLPYERNGYQFHEGYGYPCDLGDDLEIYGPPILPFFEFVANGAQMGSEFAGARVDDTWRPFDMSKEEEGTGEGNDNANGAPMMVPQDEEMTFRGHQAVAPAVDAPAPIAAPALRRGARRPAPKTRFADEQYDLSFNFNLKGKGKGNKSKYPRGAARKAKKGAANEGKTPPQQQAKAEIQREQKQEQELKEERGEESKVKEVVKGSHGVGYTYMGLVDKKATKDRITPKEVLKRAIDRAYEAKSLKSEAESLKIANPNDQETIISLVEHMCDQTKVNLFRREALRALLRQQAALNAQRPSQRAQKARLWPTGDFVGININSATGKAMPVKSGLPGFVAYALKMDDYRPLHTKATAQHWKTHANLRRERRANA